MIEIMNYSLNNNKIMNDFWNYNRNKMLQEVQDENAEPSALAVENTSEQLPPLPEEVHIDMEDKPEQPKLATDENGSYQCFVLTPSTHRERIEKALTEMAKTDEELAKAIAEGKKTFDGCDRFIRNNMQDLMRELKVQGCCGMSDEQIHALARWYMVNADVTDVKSAVKTATTKKKTEKKSKDSGKKSETKTEKTEEKKAEVVDMFAEFFK